MSSFGKDKDLPKRPTQRFEHAYNAYLYLRSSACNALEVQVNYGFSLSSATHISAFGPLRAYLILRPPEPDLGYGGGNTTDTIQHPD